MNFAISLASDICVQISGTKNSGDGRINLQQLNNSLWGSVNPLPFDTISHRITKFQLDVLDCNRGSNSAAPSCSWEVSLVYCKKDGICSPYDPTYRVGTFFASGQGPDPYRITGGTGSFRNVRGAIDSVFDFRNTSNLLNIEIQLCYKSTVICGTRQEVKGKCEEQESLVVSSNDTKYAVHYCSDSFKDRWLKMPQCDVWRESDAPGCCFGDATFDEAVQFCSDAGARLCTAEEVRNECSSGT